MQRGIDQKNGKVFKVIGMMSGTSLDGIDLSYCSYYKKNAKWSYELHAAKTYPYAIQIIQAIQSIQNKNIQYFQFNRLQLIYTKYLVQAIRQFKKDFVILWQQCDAVSVHGHTVYHNPGKYITIQIADIVYMAAQLQMNVIGNFRQLDVYRGGQGAPLAPFAQELFHQSKEQGEKTAFLNLGGIANIGFKGKGTDIHFCNMVFNHFSKKLEGKQFDKDGHLGKEGTFSEQVYIFLIKQYGYKGKYSLAREDFEQFICKIEDRFHNLLKQINGSKIFICTFYYFLSEKILEKTVQITQADSNQQIKIICSGGGTYNSFLIESICKLQFSKSLSKLQYIIPNSSIVQFKQSILFGLLGVKYLTNEQNCQHGIGGVMVKGSFTK